MKANRNKYRSFHRLISAVLIALGAVGLGALPISASINAEGGLSYSKNAFADETKNKGVMGNGVRPTATGRSHASVNSVVGLLAIYQQKFNDVGSFGKSKYSILNNEIAAMELDLSNPYLGDEERKSIEAKLAVAENELALVMRTQQKYNDYGVTGIGRVSKNITQKFSYILGIAPSRENSDIDMMEAGGKPD